MFNHRFANAVQICRKDMQGIMVDNDALSVMRTWLEPLPDGSLPNMNIRKSILEVLEQVNFWIFLSREGPYFSIINGS
jgi:hypothetical protein